MYARITTYQAKSGKLDEANEKVETMKPEIMSIPGIKHWICCADEDGNCIVIAIYENKAAVDAAAPKAQELFGRFAEYYETAPQPHSYEVLHMESND